MKKVSKIFALGLALAMTFGMTVSAAPSISTGTDVSDKVEASGAGVSSAEIPEAAKNIDVPAVDVSSLSTDAQVKLSQEATEKLSAVKEVNVTSDIKVPEKVSSVTVVTKGTVGLGVMAVASQVADKAVSALKLNAASAPVVKAAIDIDLNVVGGSKADVFAANGNGIKVAFNAGITPAANTKYLVLHQLASGAWETVPASIAQDGTVIATFTSLSPVIIVEVAEKAGTPAPTPKPEDKQPSNGNSGNNNTTPAASNGESPKTGETLPVAGLMTVICLAGAVVCAKRVRYNK